MRFQTTPGAAWRRAAALAAVVAVAAVYWWTVGTTGARLRPLPEHSDYYNLLARGFARGHTYLAAEVDPRMLALAPADRPGNAPFLFDASLYGEHYYLYFGVVPVLAVELPFTILTGRELPEAAVAALAAFAAFLAGCAWWREIRRAWLPGLSVRWDFACVVALGLCTAAPSALRRPAFYEIAIAAGCACTLFALWAATRACLNPRRAVPWLALAGVGVGLAAGCRANLVPAGILMLLVAARRCGFRPLLAAGGGAAAVGAGLMAYNFARFGNPLEFGHAYQLGVNPRQFFHFTNLTHNLGLYYGMPPSLNGYFPFVAPAAEGPKPDDYIGREHVHGEWLWALTAAVALAGAAWAVRRGRGPQRPGLLGALALPAVLFGANLLVTASTGVRANRYMLDFHPALVLLTVGLLGCAVAAPGAAGRLVRAAAAAGVVLAVAFNLLASVQAQGFYRLSDPEGYRRLARATDNVVARLAPDRVGDREARIVWPGPGGGWRREPLLSAGSMDFEDILWLEFNGEGRVRLLYEHGEYGSAVGAWFDYAPGMESSVRVGGALLLPPVTHPWYGPRTPDERSVLKRHLRVRVDGVDRLSRDVPSFDSSPGLQHWGAWHPGDRRPMQTRVSSTAGAPVDESWARERAAEQGAFRFTVTLPRDRFGIAEPLLQGGDVGRFDTVAVHYTGPDRIRIVHDQLSAGSRVSGDFAVDYSRPQQVEIETPVATDGLVWTDKGPVETDKPPSGIRVRWNGRDVFAPAIPPVATTRAAIAIGVNAWQASSALVQFSGTLDEHEAPAPAGVVGPGSLEGRLPGQPWLAAERGVLARFTRPDGERAAVVWRTAGPSGAAFQVGWLEAGETAWSREIDRAAPPIRLLRITIQREPAWVEIEADGRSLVAQKSNYFATGTAAFAAISPREWSGSALGAAADQGRAAELPGRVRLRFIIPADAGGADPLLVAGQPGKADLLYLRSLGGGRYVFGIDHWGIGVSESPPVSLAPREVHTVLIEMSSLFPPGTAPRPGIRLWSDSALAWDAAPELYPAAPGQVLIGRSLEGMSTSFPAFRGEMISIRTREPAP